MTRAGSTSLAARETHASNEHDEHETDTPDGEDVQERERNEIRDRRQTPLDNRVETGRIPPLDESRIHRREAGQQRQHNRTETESPPHPTHYLFTFRTGSDPITIRRRCA